MKKVMKRFGMSIIAFCMMFIIPAITGYAAEGTLQFSDPSGKVGEEIGITVKIEGGGLPVGDGNVTVSYDTGMLEFVSGTNASGGDGTVTLSASGTGAETELRFELVFKALAEGETSLSATSATAYLYSDETLNLQLGTSTVKIEPGDGTAVSSGSEERKVGEANIEIAGTMYGIYENFTDALIPEGFSKTTITYNGEEHNAIRQDASGKTIVFLITGTNDPVLAVYGEDGQFVVTEQISQGEDFYLFVLGEGDGSKLPENFQETTIEINGTSFPAWQNMESQDYFLMYALSSSGQESYYQYDSVEGTYQRYTLDVAEKTEEEKPDNSLLGKVKTQVDNYFPIVLAGAAAVFLLLIIILIVLGVKLRQRNAELNEFYDEYDDEEEQSQRTGRTKSRKQFVGYEEDDEEDDYDDDFLEEDEYEDEFEDGFSEDDEYEDEFDEDFSEDDDYDDFLEEDDEYDDDDRKEQGYDIDFIDL